MKTERYWRRDITEEENESLLDLLSKFTGDKLKYGTYTVVVHRNEIKAVRSERSVEVIIIDGQPATSPEPKSIETKITRAQQAPEQEKNNE
jgi:hypothetical protein